MIDNFDQLFVCWKKTVDQKMNLICTPYIALVALHGANREEILVNTEKMKSWSSSNSSNKNWKSFRKKIDHVA